MAKRKRYDDQFRASAILLLEGQGYPNKLGALKSVADHLGVPERTLQRWHKGDSNPPPDNIVALKKDEIVDELFKVMGLLLAAVPDKIGDAPLREVMQGIGITADKIQIYTGGPTENVNMTWEHIFGGASNRDTDNDPYA